MRWWHGLVVVLVLTASAGAGLQGYRVYRAQQPPEHRVHLDGFRLQAPDGSWHELAEWSGQPLLLNFWASWCEPCRVELPWLERLSARYPQVAVIGVAIDEADAIRVYLRQHIVSYPVLVGAQDAIQFAGAVGNTAAAVPYTAVLDGDGVLVYRQAGLFEPAELEGILLQLSTPQAW